MNNTHSSSTINNPFNVPAISIKYMYMAANQTDSIHFDNLFRLLKIKHIDTQKKEEFLSTIEELTFHLAVNFVLETLTMEDAQLFLTLLDEDETEEEAFNYAREKIPEFDNQLTKLLMAEIKNVI